MTLEIKRSPDEVLICSFIAVIFGVFFVKFHFILMFGTVMKGEAMELEWLM